MRTLSIASVLLTALAMTSLAPTGPGPAADDGRAGTVADRQGLATFRPADRQRWTPLGRDAVLLPGDLVRTGLDGANAVEIRLEGEGGGSLLVGPGSLCELGRRTVRILRGACEIDPGQGRIAVRGPGGFERDLATRTVLQSDGTATRALDQDPRWLSGYRSSTTAEWMGSLVARVDGRDLTLGIDRHHVDVVVRDQVAETTIDQDYRNATEQELEGVFTFPLPPEASVSSFAMWVGGEMVEADIVERSRAREIYEDLKARKKDPGLLEWSGGNLFTARVWPIPARGQKRIRIRYTQVLPLEGRTFRYLSALRSDATRDHPIRDLQVRVRVVSSRALAEVRCSSHEAVVRADERSAELQWSAENVRPDRDFEVRATLADTAPVTVVDHARDGQGYFMVLLTPPGEEAGWARATTPEGPPTELVLIADTSGSMDEAARATQRATIAALLAMLGENDRFRLLAADREAVWFRDGRAGPDEAAAALAFLDGRASLGWSDLDLAFRTAFEACGPGATVVYLGDGRITTGAADAQAFAQRLGRLAEGRDLSCHAIVTSNAFDQVALDAIARIGGGSRREAGADPAATAFAFWTDAKGPGLKDARVSFEGLRTARVYPEVLANVPVGRQRAVLGRYQVGEGEPQGTVVLEGKLRGEPVRWTRPVRFGRGDADASFLPRLWARSHAEALLAEGASPAAREEVVALSAEFGFMTPLTSFLVLEDEADRERYGVTRRVRMSDGERFFAAARERAQRDAQRDAIAAARIERLSLRERALREITGLGRDRYGWAVGSGGDGGVPAGWDVFSIGSGQPIALPRVAGPTVTMGVPAPGGPATPGAAGPATKGGDVQLNFDARFEQNELGEQANFGLDSLPEVSLEAGRAFAGEERRKAGPPSPGGGFYRGPGDMVPPRPQPGHRGALGARFGFPSLAPFTAPAAERPAPDWPAAALDALRAIDRRRALAALAVPLSIAIEERQLHGPSGSLTGLSRQRILWSPGGWAITARSVDGADPSLRWSLDGRTGIVDLATGLGRSRETDPGEARILPFGLPAAASRDLVDELRDARARILREDEAALVLELEFDLGDGSLARHLLTIDRARGLLVRHEILVDGRPLQTTLVEAADTVAGISLPTRVLTQDRDGRTTARTTVRVAALDEAELVRALDAVRGTIGAGLVIEAEDPALDAAFEAAHAGRAGLPEQLEIVAFLLGIGRHEAAVERFETEVGPNPGAGPSAPWLWLRALAAARSGATLAAEAAALAARLAAAGPDPDAFARARLLVGGLASSLHPHDRLALIETLQPSFAEADADAARLLERRTGALRAQLLEAAERPEEALALREALADTGPSDLGATLAAVRAARELGELEAAEARLAAALARRASWTNQEFDQLAATLAELLLQRRDLAGLQDLAAQWVAAGTGSEAAFDLRLSVRLFAGREDEAVRAIDALTERDLVLDPGSAGRAEVVAAVRHLLGSGWNYHRRTLLEADLPRLDALARRLCAVDAGIDFAWPILGDARFRQSDRGRALVDALQAQLSAAAVPDLSPARARLFASEAFDPRRLDAAAWDALRAALQARALEAPSPVRREVWTGLVLHLADARADAGAALDHLRARLAAETDGARIAELSRRLLPRLAQQDWTQALEAEMFTLGGLARDPHAQAPDRLVADAEISRWLADQLERMRRAALLGEIADLEKLPRAERRSREQAARQTAATELAAAFAAAAKAAGEDRALWLRLEALCFHAETAGEDRDDARRAAVALFDAAAKLPAEAPFPRHCRTRTSLALALLAVRRGAPDGLAEQVLAEYRQRAAAEPDRLDWRAEELRLLAALDRRDELLARLDAWITPGRIERELRQLRASLRIEAGAFEAAIADLLLVADAAFLPADRFEMLGRCALARGDEAGYERARTRRLDAMAAHELQALATASATAEGGRLDETAALALRAMMQKAEDPADHLWTVRSLYRRTKDFRALACLADGAVGHPPRRAYPFLGRAAERLAEVHEEASLDELARALDGVDARSATDRRALALLRHLTALRATQVGGAGASHHRAAAAQALRSALADLDVLADDERRPLAELLAALPPLADEELRALRREAFDRLHAPTSPGSPDDLAIAAARARAAWADGAPDLAIEGLAAALERQLAATGRGLPRRTMPRVDNLLGWFGARGRFVAAERWLTEARARSGSADLGRLLDDRIDGLHAAALGAGAPTSLGQGEALLAAATARLERRLAAAPPDQLDEIVERACALHLAARQPVPASASRSLLAFVARHLPDLRRRSPLGTDDLVRKLAHGLAEVAGPAAALRLYVDACRDEAPEARRLGQDLWSNFGWSIATLRSKAGTLPPDLEAGLRALVLGRLEQALTQASGERHSIWSQGHRYFWAELRPDFLTTARRVAELQADSDAVLRDVARYLKDGLHETREAIRCLQPVAGRGTLSLDDRATLAGWLLEVGEFEQAWPQIEALLAGRDLVLDDRLLAIRALSGMGRTAEARAMVETTEARFDAADRLGETGHAQLADACRAAGIHDLAARGYERAIRSRERSRPSGPDGTLALWHGHLAGALAQLGQADAAVEAAGAAVVRSGTDQSRRRAAVEALHGVLRTVADLEAWLAAYDAKVAAEGLDAPLIRKALGAVLGAQPERALDQYRKALALQPEDRETHDRIVALLDRLGRPAEAAAATWRAVRIDPTDLGRIRALAQRLRDLDRRTEAERALSELVEHRPHEADGHAVYAEALEEAGRFAEAVEQRRQAVRARPDDPDERLRLAATQIRADDRPGARRTLEEVLAGSWAERFKDAKDRALALLRDL